MAGFGRAGTMSTTTQKPDITTDVAVKLEDMCQVVLHNDDHNIADHVVRCVFLVTAPSLLSRSCWKHMKKEWPWLKWRPRARPACTRNNFNLTG